MTRVLNCSANLKILSHHETESVIVVIVTVLVETSFIPTRKKSEGNLHHIPFFRILDGIVYEQPSVSPGNKTCSRPSA